MPWKSCRTWEESKCALVDTSMLCMPKNNINADGGITHTTDPVQTSQATDAEFLDARGVEARFGIKRSLAYTLLGEGLIRGVSLRRRGQTKGKRLFCVSSIRTYLGSQMEQQGGEI